MHICQVGARKDDWIVHNVIKTHVLIDYILVGNIIILVIDGDWTRIIDFGK